MVEKKEIGRLTEYEFENDLYGEKFSKYLSLEIMLSLPVAGKDDREFV